MVLRSEEEIRKKRDELDAIHEGSNATAIVTGVMVGCLSWVLMEEDKI